MDPENKKPKRLGTRLKRLPAIKPLPAGKPLAPYSVPDLPESKFTAIPDQLVMFPEADWLELR